MDSYYFARIGSTVKMLSFAPFQRRVTLPIFEIRLSIAFLPILVVHGMLVLHALGDPPPKVILAAFFFASV